MATNKQREYELTLRLAAVMSKDYQETFDRAREALKELGYDTESVGEAAQKAAEQQENAFQLAAAALAETGLTDALGRIKGAYVDILQTSADFQYQMSAVEAIAGVSYDDLDALESKARELGATTVYTATQSAEAMQFMAQAGWDAQEMMEGMDGVIALAAASGIDLSSASTIVADTLAGFGMEASETTRLVDVLAQSAARADTSVSLMGETFKSSASVAGALGFTIEDVSALVGLLGDVGVKGSRASTTLRNIISGLAKSPTIESEAFGEYELKMFTDEGEARGLKSILDEMRELFAQMTAEEQYNAAYSIAGERGYNGLLAVMNTTDEKYQKLYQSIGDATGAAEEMAKIRLDNLRGDVTLCQSALESLKNTIGDELTPTARDATQLATEWIGRADEFLKLNPEVIRGVTAITAALAAGAAVLTGISATLKVISAVKIAAGMLSGLPGVVAGLAALSAGVYTLSVMEQNAADNMEEVYRQYDQLQAIYYDGIQSHREAIVAIDGEAENTQELISRLESLMEVESKTPGQKEEILAIVEKLNKAVPELALAYDAEADSLNNTAEGIRAVALAEAERRRNERKYERLIDLEDQAIEIQGIQEEAQRKYDDAVAAFEAVGGQYDADAWGNNKSVAVEDLENYRSMSLGDKIAYNDAQKELERASLELDSAMRASSQIEREIGRITQDIADYQAGLAEGQEPYEEGEVFVEPPEEHDTITDPVARGLFDYMSRGQTEEESAPVVSEEDEAYITTLLALDSATRAARLKNELPHLPAYHVNEPIAAGMENYMREFHDSANITVNVNANGAMDSESAQQLGDDIGRKVEDALRQIDRQRARTLYESEGGNP